MKIVPLADRLIIKTDKFEEVTAGGIVLPDMSKDDLTVKYHTATVVAVGEGRTLPDSGTVVPVEARPGDRVVYSKFSGTKLKDEYEGHLLLKEVDILAIIEEVPNESN
jgi:chaperonin GroES